jgi:cyclophilin family peptidyl-prolyl cis-trans isomerase
VKRRASGETFPEGSNRFPSSLDHGTVVSQESSCFSSDYSDHSPLASPVRSPRSRMRKLSDEFECDGFCEYDVELSPGSWTSPLEPLAPTANPQSPGDAEEVDRTGLHSQYHAEHPPTKSYHSQPRSSPISMLPSRSTSQNESCLPLRDTLVFTARKRKSTFSFAVMAFCVVGFSLYSNARSTLRSAVNEVNDLVSFSERLHRQLGRADRDMRMLQRELAALDAIEQKREDEEVEERVLSQSSAFANPKLIQEMNNIQRKLKFSQTQADVLKTKVSDLSKRDAIAKYGSGVIRVQLELIFPPASPVGGIKTGEGALKPLVVDSGPTMIVIEMSSLDLMPHSVYTFLEMVSTGLLNGCSFILNALHVLKAAPLPYDGTSASDKARAFLDSGLNSVAFREYSPDYPHLKHTIGFAADGSPSFYINTEDNSEIHVGDPCFGKIISGFDTIDRLETMPTRNGIWFEHRIGIKEATIL